MFPGKWLFEMNVGDMVRQVCAALCLDQMPELDLSSILPSSTRGTRAALLAMGRRAE